MYGPTEPSQPMMSDDVSDKDRPQHRELCPLLFSNSVWVLLCPTELYVDKVCETGPLVYHPYLRRLESLTFVDFITKTALFPLLF